MSQKIKPYLVDKSIVYSFISIQFQMYLCENKVTFQHLKSVYHQSTHND